MNHSIFIFPVESLEKLRCQIIQTWGLTAASLAIAPPTTPPAVPALTQDPDFMQGQPRLMYTEAG